MRISDPDVALGIKTGGSIIGSTPPNPFGVYPGGYDSTGQFHGDSGYREVTLLEQSLAAFFRRPGSPELPVTVYTAVTSKYGDFARAVRPKYGLRAQNERTKGYASDAGTASDATRTGQPMTLEQVTIAITGQTPIDTVEIGVKRWAQFLITVNGEPTFLYYRDAPQEWFTERAPGP